MFHGGVDFLGSVSNGGYPTYAETWIWDGERSERRFLDEDPVSDRRRALGFHPVFGAAHGNAMWMLVDDEATWSWDHWNAGWQTVPTTLHPTGAGDLVFDANEERTVFVSSDGLYLYDAEAPGWQLASASPGTHAAWDARANRVIAMGCDAGGNVSLHELVAETFSERTMTGAPPCGDADLAFDGRAGRPVVVNTAGAYWLATPHEAAIEEILTDAPTVPDVNYLAYDSQRQQVVGVGASTWIRQGGVWTNTSVAAPAARPIAFDPVLFMSSCSR